jgi:shikimate 5-dehydrogenase
LVTTHKIDLYAACQDLFDDIDVYARTMGETSCLSKRGGRFVCHAKDPITAGLAVDGFLPPQHFERSGAEVLAIGAGGSTIALTCHLMQAARGADRPGRVLVSDRSPERLHEIERIHRALQLDVPCEYRLVDSAADNDALLASLKPGAFVVNATGLGKDRPGSPLTDAAVFPQGAIAWDLNYRGQLVFLDQARRQQAARGLQVEGGWTYFLYGWTRVIAEVFDIAIATSGPEFDALSRIAEQAGKPEPTPAANPAPNPS